MRCFSMPGILCLALCLFLAGSALAAPAKVKVNPADIPTMDAGELLNRISRERGKVVVVNVFASWCPPCRDEIPSLVKVRQAFPESSVVLLGVSIDREPRALAKYMSDLHVNYPVFLADSDFALHMGVTAVPQLFIYDKRGDLAVNHRGLVDEVDLYKALNEILAE